jgi:hypothetical protein
MSGEVNTNQRFSLGPQRGPSSVARIEAQRKAVQRELEAMDAEDMFTCRKCGSMVLERYRSGNTEECVFC